MRGNNILQLCTAELLVAVQEYLDKRMRNYAPLAYDIQARDGTFYILLKEQPKQEMEADPCPQCIEGTGPQCIEGTDPCPQCIEGVVCRTPTCGRLKLQLGPRYRNNHA